MARQLCRVFLAALLVVWVAVLPQATSHATNDDALSRTDDHSVLTSQARREALAQIQAALPQVRANGESLRLARLLNRAGTLQIQLNSPDEARNAFQESLAVLKNVPDPTSEIDALNGLATAYHRAGRCAEAESLLHEAIEKADLNGYVAGKAEALLVLSFCQNYHDYAVALATADQAFALWQSLDNKLGMARSHAAKAHYYLAQNNLTEATKSNEESLRLWRELNVNEEEAEVLILLGFIEYRKGAWQGVLTYLAQAQAMLDETAEPYKMGQINAGIGEAFLELDLPESGLAKLLEAQNYFHKAQNQRAVNVVNWDIGTAYYLMGNQAEGIATLQRTLLDAEAIKDISLEAMCHDFLGRTFLQTNDIGNALKHFETALELYTRVSKQMEAARTRSLIGEVFVKQGRIKEARTFHLTALNSFRAFADHVNESATLYALGRLELSQNNLNAAEEHLRQSIAVTEDIRRVSSSSDLTAAFSATVHDRYEAYIECLMRQHHLRPDMGLAKRAFELSEQGRARSLSELLRATHTNLVPGVDPRLAEQEKSLRQELRVKEDSKVALLAHPYKKAALEAIDIELNGLRRQYDLLLGNIRREHPSYGQISRPIGWTLREIQEHVVMDDDTLLLEYSLGQQHSFVWAVTRDRLTTYELPGREAIIKDAVEVQRWLVTKPESRTQQESPIASFSQIVLGPLRSDLTKRRMIIIADGPLNYIPFQALIVPGKSEPLVVNYEVINAPSASIVGEIRQEAKQRSPRRTLAAFGDPVFASSYAQTKAEANGEPLNAMQVAASSAWQTALRDIELNGDRFEPSVITRLFYAKRELANLREAAGSDSLVASEFDATREKLLTTDLTSYSILHFATHGFLDPKRPEKSGLVLSTVDRDGKELNGFVGLQDIYQLRAPVDLVVLSACQTGLGKDVRGEGLLGLTRGFMYAGASSVVASLWKVDDEATAALMKQFYENLLHKGMTPSAALREAQNTIRQRPEWSAPYYWAAFTLQGEYRNPITPKARSTASTKPAVVGTILVLLAVATTWYLRRRRLVHSTVKK
jgi:CHAT domain-containing protein/predicted negative regulator of RcsB-dependent stress response